MDDSPRLLDDLRVFAAGTAQRARENAAHTDERPLRLHRSLLLGRGIDPEHRQPRQKALPVIAREESEHGLRRLNLDRQDLPLLALLLVIGNDV